MSEQLRKPADQAGRDIIENELNKTVLVEAAAGTGKTTSMVRRMVNLLAKGHCRIETVAAVTFTRKAASELRSRFQLVLEKQVEESVSVEKQRLGAALEGVEKCFIGTIHSFCARILRERPVEAGVDVAFEEIDDATDRQLRVQAWHEYVHGLYASGDDILAELNEIGVEIGELQESFMSFAGYPDVREWPARAIPLPDLASAGQTLADMVAHMDQVADQLPENAGRDTLIPLYRTVPRMFRQAKPTNRSPELLEILAEFGKVTIVQKMWPGGKHQALQELERYEAFRTSMAEPLVRAWREYRYEPLFRALRPAQEVYDDLRARSGKLNFQDLLIKAAGLLRTRPGVRRYFRRRFTHLLVDEFQDTDPIQAEVMMLLTADDAEETDWRQCRPAAGSLFVVGDPKQSIYRFRRADIVTYNQVKEIIGGSGGLVVNLTTNFRTIKPLIDWVNATFAESFFQHPPQCSPEYVPLEPFRYGQEDAELSGLRVIGVPKELSKNEEVREYEADLVARVIRHSVDAGLRLARTEKEIEAGASSSAAFGDFLIITPHTKNLSLYSKKLREYDIPNQVTGGSAMNRVSELALLHTCLAALAEPDNPVALVAVLRSDIFGFSDSELFRFVQVRGRFDFHSEIPDGLEDATAELFRDAFGRMRKYAQWLAQLPHVAAIEKIAADLGLLARAAASSGGDVQAGSFAKALELLRAAQSQSPTTGDLVDCLRRFVQAEDTYDAISVLPGGTSVVRVMNLHKVKGLEAPVVFLADPTGKKDFPPSLHVDRSGPTPRGYLLVHGEIGGRLKPLAQPEGWSVFEETERRFQAAEQLRLLYVAATRAGAHLIVTQRGSGQGKNPWAFFDNGLKHASTIEEIRPVAPVQTAPSTLIREDVDAAIGTIGSQWESASAKSYEVASVKATTLQLGKFTYSHGEHGVEWGSVIHLLLEAAMKNPDADILHLARSALSEQGLEMTLADEALENVQSVTRSDLWQRALRSTRRLVEVPFQRLIPGDGTSPSLGTVLRGIIDLAFLEPQGWVIVDYKSDRVPAGRVPDLVEMYSPQVLSYAQAWAGLTGEAVHEAGIYFTHLQKYVPLQSPL